jgi:hypothetical protein
VGEKFGRYMQAMIKEISRRSSVYLFKLPSEGRASPGLSQLAEIKKERTSSLPFHDDDALR